MKLVSFFLASALAVGVFTSQAAVQTAGSLLVNVDPAPLALGPVLSVPNSGTAGGAFDATGLADVDQPVIIAVGGGAKAILFDGHNFMEHVDAPGGTIVPVPAGLVGNNPQYSIEAWVINPTLFSDDIETIVAWGTRTVGLGNMAFGYSTQNDHGAVDRWGGNMGWNPAPAAGVWHHLVYTFDGGTTRIYADGTLRGTLAGSINTVAGQPITLAAQRNPNGSVSDLFGPRGSLSLGKLRIHSGVLSDAQVSNNFDAEKAVFVAAPTPLVSRPIHRYSFDNPASANATDATVADTGTLAGEAAVIRGAASFTGTAVRLPGGDSATAGYVDLPNGLVSLLSTNSGGPGELTYEGWVDVTGFQSWMRYFDFGSSTGGEISGPGGGGPGMNYFMLSELGGARDLGHCEVNNDGFNSGPGGASVRDFGMQNGNAPYGVRHYAVSWKESTGEIVVYENGIESTRFITDKKFNQVDDVNDWLGRSNWTTDSNLQGDYDEFRVYNRILSAAEVINDFAAGPAAVAVEPGNLVALHLQAPRTNMVAGTIGQSVVIADYQNVTNVNVTARPGVVFNSSNTNVATVSVDGLIQAVAPGTASISVTYAGSSTQLAITVTPTVATLAHRYSFNDATTSTTATDSVGGAAGNGTLQGGAIFDGTQVELDGQSGFVELPAYILGTPDAVTIESWVTFNASALWARLFDFGDQNAAATGARTTFFLSPHAGGDSVNLTIDGGSGARFVTRPRPLDGQTNVHVVAVITPDAASMSLYINGVLVASRNDETTPISAINNVFSWIGKSLYPNDGFLNASVDEFRIYNGTLTPDKIAVNAAAGPNQIVTDPGALQSVSLSVSNQIAANMSVPALFLGNFANVQNVNLFSYGAPTVSSDNTNVVTVSANGSVRAVATGTANLTFQFGGKTATQAVTVVEGVPALRHRYSFRDDVGQLPTSDLVGGSAWDGTLQGNATTSGGALVLDGLSSYLELPAQIVQGYYALTIEAWVTFGPNNNWSRLWDFGSQTSTGNGETSLFLSPHTGSGGVEMTEFVPGVNEHIALSTNLDNTTSLHVVGVYFPAAGYQELYLNGALAGANHGATLPLSAVNDQLNWIGRSLFNADPYLNASIDELRIYEGAMTAAQVAADFTAGPNSLPTAGPKLTVSMTASTLRISWPSTVTGFSLQSSAAITGGWGPGPAFTTQGAENVATDTIPTTAGAKFYRLIKSP